jgi:hypothetical protein
LPCNGFEPVHIEQDKVRRAEQLNQSEHFWRRQDFWSCKDEDKRHHNRLQVLLWNFESHSDFLQR